MNRTRAGLIALAAILGTLAVAPVPAPAATPQEARLRPPVFGTNINGDQFRNFPDPSIIRVGNRYWGYSTHQTGLFAKNIMVMASDDLWNWDAHAADPIEAMPTPPTWARRLNNGGAFWAPSVIRTGGRYVMYFGARHKNISADRPGWCIGVATSVNPQGPFQARNAPLFCRVNSTGNTPASFSSTPASGKGAFDPQVFRAPNGRLYLYFKAIDNLRQLWGVRLSADGLSRVGPGHGFAPLDSQARTWEYSTRLHFTVLENPAMVFNPTPGVSRPFLLFYAGGEWQIPSNYGTGYLACETPLSGCSRLTRARPWLISRGTNAGPGGVSTFTGPDNKPWVAYHTYLQGHVMDGYGRRLHVEPLTFAGVHPRLHDRRPIGDVDATAAGGGQVDFTGTADDPDTGRQVRVRVRRATAAGPVIEIVTAGPAGNWNFDLDGETLGAHDYCATAIDDNGLSDGPLGCVNVVVT